MKHLLARIDGIVTRAPNTAACVLTTIDCNIEPTVDDVLFNLDRALKAGTFISHAPCRNCRYLTPERNGDKDGDEDGANTDAVNVGDDDVEGKKSVILKKEVIEDDDGEEQGGSDSDSSVIAVKSPSPAPPADK